MDEEMKNSPSIFLELYAKNHRYGQLMRLMDKVGLENPLERLVGMHRDTEETHLVFSVPVTKDTKSTLLILQGAFMHLYDYYPAITEKPSEQYVETAIKFKQALVNPTMSPSLSSPENSTNGVSRLPSVLIPS